MREIGAYAFDDCRRLQKVSFAEGSRLERVGYRAFAGYRLRAFAAPPALKTIEEYAFCSCAGLRVAALSEGLEEVGERAFASSGVEEALVPAGVREIGESAFEGCEQLREVRFAEGSRLERVGKKAFARTGLREAAVPASVRALAFSAFHDCEFERLVLPARFHPFQALGCFAEEVKEVVVPP